MSLDETLPRSLVNEGGESFADQLIELQEQLAALSNPARRAYRDQNAAAVATNPTARILIVAGPGAGKSHLFMDRIRYWLRLKPDAEIYVASFVRKLVRDLENDVKTSPALEDADRQRVTVTTLHTLARSLLERNHGTAAQTFEPHIKVISGEWESMVWQDVLKFHAGLDGRTFSHRRFAKQFHTEVYDDSDDWKALRKTYALLTMFYNAVGFPDMIVLARQALEEDPELNRHRLWIIDEFQDFNTAEEHLIRSIVETADGVLIAGDDEQALYQQLKASLPEIIISYYDDGAYANAMLPYCSRCSYYTCLAASGFIARHRIENAIAKIYLPLKEEAADPKVQVIATATPASAVDYIEKFVKDHQTQLEIHKQQMEAGEENEPFLLILTPAKQMKFYKTGNADTQLRKLVSQWSVVKLGRSPDYRQIATYSAVAWDKSDNFSARKALAYEGVDLDTVHELLEAALGENAPLSEIISRDHPEILAKCQAVADALVSDELTEAGKVERIGAVFPLADPERLEAELAAHPLGFLSIVAADEGEEAIETADIAAPIELLTMVGAKGLSAQHVIVIGCDEVNMKNVSALTFFVALTRARRSLHLISSAKAGGGTTLHPFVVDLPQEFCEYKAYKKTGRVTESLRGASALTQKMASWARAAARASRTRRR